ncbi:hypothetical protein KCQ_12110 [Pectobacterium atrosepticum ICMP 1526]|nr:hypothetical protein KCQ_12110 [Pectobacterium atrosepticum ICMP 1526]
MSKVVSFFSVKIIDCADAEELNSRQASKSIRIRDSIFKGQW